MSDLIGGMSKKRLERVTASLTASVERGQIAGAVAVTHRRGEEAYAMGIGWQDLERLTPMRRQTIFRIASMTKPIVAVLALSLVEEGRLRLFDPVDAWLPELADRKVLKDPMGPIEEVSPSPRPITLHDILTFRLGLGWGPSTLAAKLYSLMPLPVAEVGRIPGAKALSPDAFMAEIGALPLVYPPGERWLYHTGADILGVLVARVVGKPLEVALYERVLGPLGMNDTRFDVPVVDRPRLAVLYGSSKGKIKVRDLPEHTRWGDPPVFASGGAGLVSTADDYLRFGRMLLNKGELDGVRILSRKTVEAMLTDYLTPEQHAHPFSNFDRYDLDGSAAWDNRGFGYCISVRTKRVGLGPSVGSFYWPGAFGTTWMADPTEDMVTALMIQMSFENPFYTRIGEDYLQAMYQAIAD